MKKQYWNCCVNSTSETIDAMTDKAVQIDYDDLLEQVEVDDIKTLFPYYNWTDDEEGLTLKDDFAVSYWQSMYRCHPCVYIVHSSIEYIFW